MNESVTVYGRKPQMLHTETEVNRKKWIIYETEKTKADTLRSPGRICENLKKGSFWGESKT